MLVPGCCKRSCAGTFCRNGLPAEAAPDNFAATSGDAVYEAETCAQEAYGKDSAGTDTPSVEPARCTCCEGEISGPDKSSDEASRCICRKCGKIGNATFFSGSSHRN